MKAARLIQSLGWLGFLALLLLGGGYANYIAAWQHGVLVAATVLFGAMVLIDAVLNRAGAQHEHHDHDHGNATDQWIQTLVHLLPLFLVLAIGVTTLGSQAITSLHRPTAYPARPVAPAGEATVAPVPAGAVTLDLLELYFPRKHPGVERIETIGRVMIPSAEEQAKAPPGLDRADLRLLLYRHVMTCCAADASPVVVVLHGRAPDGLKVDDWVRVTGTWIPAPGLGDMAKIVVERLSVIPAPKEPFLQAPKE